MILYIYIGLMVVMSLYTYYLYYKDKKASLNNEWRVDEKTLLFCGFFFGSIGGLISMYINRHKTKKWYFWTINALSLIFHIYMLALIIINIF